MCLYYTYICISFCTQEGDEDPDEGSEGDDSDSGEYDIEDNEGGSKKRAGEVTGREAQKM